MPFPKASASSKIDALINIPKKAPKVSSPNGNLQEAFDGTPVKPERPTKQPVLKKTKAEKTKKPPAQFSAAKKGNYESLMPDKPAKTAGLAALLGARQKPPKALVGM